MIDARRDRRVARDLDALGVQWLLQRRVAAVSRAVKRGGPSPGTKGDVPEYTVRGSSHGPIGRHAFSGKTLMIWCSVASEPKEG
jgi:hypothetical protein